VRRQAQVGAAIVAALGVASTVAAVLWLDPAWALVALLAAVGLLLAAYQAAVHGEAWLQSRRRKTTAD
jgi:hypothetical protein